MQPNASLHPYLTNRAQRSVGAKDIDTKWLLDAIRSYAYQCYQHGRYRGRAQMLNNGGYTTETYAGEPQNVAQFADLVASSEHYEKAAGEYLEEIKRALDIKPT